MTGTLLQESSFLSIPKNWLTSVSVIFEKIVFCLTLTGKTLSMHQRIYIDTSVVGGYFDEEFKDVTRELFKRLEKNEVIFVVSDLLETELIEAPKHIRELLYNYAPQSFERVLLSEEAIKLADAYIAENVVGRTSLEDCRHIAIATICKVDVLASWNFKHIVNLNRIKGYNSVNLRLGFQMLEIRSPKDLINYGND
jgi:hypothetical protein